MFSLGEPNTRFPRSFLCGTGRRAIAATPLPAETREGIGGRRAETCNPDFEEIAAAEQLRIFCGRRGRRALSTLNSFDATPDYALLDCSACRSFLVPPHLRITRELGHIRAQRHCRDRRDHCDKMVARRATSLPEISRQTALAAS